jgi:CheY-like chemotaxis protein
MRKTREGAPMRRILVVDDDPQISPAFRAWLRRCGFGGVIADVRANGLVALDMSNSVARSPTETCGSRHRVHPEGL